MKRSALALVLTLLFGMAGLFLGAMINAEGYVGVIAAVAVTGFFVIRAIEDKHQ